MAIFGKTILCILLELACVSSGFMSPPLSNARQVFSRNTMKFGSSIDTDQNTIDEVQKLEKEVINLKKVLTREYTSFFSPMYTEYYSDDVTFTDPMIDIEGVSSYQNNVDMLASRTFMGSLLFTDAGISLHSVTGGDIQQTGKEIAIDDVITRWTLRVTAKILPWKPTARFSGISVYKLKASPSSSKPNIQIVGQTDYWDSINIQPDGSGSYNKVPTSNAVKDFLSQLNPGTLEAKQSGPELPFELLRRGDGYEVRRYPKYAAVSLPYKRRDEGFGSLGAFTRGMNPLAPAIMRVSDSSLADKTMSWPIAYAPPTNDDEIPIPDAATENAGQGQWRTMSIEKYPSQVIAVGYFNDASMEPVVRLADRQLRECLKRDGLVPVSTEEEGGVMFAQYDAIFSMGKRRGEVWIELEEGGHPW